MPHNARGDFAHLSLVTAKPAANATITPTKRIDLVFDEKIMPANTRTQLMMTSMPGMACHAPMKMPISVMMGKDGKSVMVMMTKPLTSGGYELRSMASGDDNEVISGKYAFQVK
ncbi:MULTISPECIES: copper resistance protein CopC [unclassified Parasphingorhabdus]|uniref:copper resistance protein CopC n=1 Tax=Parasphingorhabdus sp. TaxID=2709688 RepID=UPI000C0C6956|nr:MAG: copper resistance protein CopC [Sphingopyxis sp.]